MGLAVGQDLGEPAPLNFRIYGSVTKIKGRIYFPGGDQE